MPRFVVTYEHPDEGGWQRHLMPHVAWLQERLKDGSLLASGPFSDSPVKAALLIMDVPDRSTLDALIATDPFATEGLIENMTIREWDPIFGTFNNRSSMPKAP
ncbi:MAG TPA: YciI family protein [Allosphingosinicella sp.]|jgi:hypothetical protein